MRKTTEIVGRAPAEVRIAYEVAMQLRILPRFSDDGAPEGTVDRAAGLEPIDLVPAAVATVEPPIEVDDVEDEVEILLDEAS